MNVAQALVPFVVALAGALVYAIAANPKVSELGRLAFACGFLWLVYLFAGHTVRF